MQKFDWYSSKQVLALPIACEWAKPFRARVAEAKGRDIAVEAGRATIEVLTRKLRCRKWVRRRTSKAKWDGRAESRYYRSPHNQSFEIRISNHPYPKGTYPGAVNYIISPEVMLTNTVNQLLRQIVQDEQAFQQNLARKAARQLKLADRAKKKRTCDARSP